MSDALDLRPLDVGLERLLDATSGEVLAPTLLREGVHVGDDWRAGVISADLVRTGTYRDSINARRTIAKGRRARVSVRTDVFYARFLEYGTRYMPAHPVAGRTFLRDDDPVVDAMAQAIRDQINRITTSG